MINMKGIATLIILTAVLSLMVITLAMNPQAQPPTNPAITSCANKPCGFFVENGVCNGTGGFYEGGSCSLSCITPNTENNTERIVVGKCDRRGSIKCSANGICNLNSCGASKECQVITGEWNDIEYPAGFYARNGGDSVSIKVSGAHATPQEWTPLVECKIVKSDNTSVILDYWQVGDVALVYNLKPQDPEGTWNVEYCFLATDYVQNGGWYLATSGTPPQLTNATVQSILKRSSPRPTQTQWWVPIRHN